MRLQYCLFLVSLGAALSACGRSADHDNPTATGAATATMPAPATTAHSMQPAPAATRSSAASASGIDLAGIDHAVKPGNDFFKYANGNWLKTATIPPDRSSIGTFFTVFKKAEQQTADLIKNAANGHPAAGRDQRKIADFYAAYMNTDAIARHGLTPLKPELNAIDAIASRKDLARVLGDRLRQDVDPINATDFHTDHLFGLFVAQGLTDPSHNIAYLLQGGLSMPSRDYYLSGDKAMVGFRDKYKSYVAALLKQADTPHADAAAKQMFELESKIAKAQESLVDSQDPHKANNLWRVADFTRKAPGMDWGAYFKAAGLDGQQQIDAWQPSAITGLSKLVASQPLPAWKVLLRFHTLDRHAALLPEAYADLAFEFHDHVLQGVPQQLARWKRAVAATSDALGDAVGQLYVKQYFPASSRQQVETLVHNLIAAFRSRVDSLDWMTPATRKKTRAKIDTLQVYVGYPDHWRSYDGLTISADDPLANAIAVEKFDTAYKIAKLGESIDRSEWWMTPQTVNALNIPLENALNFPAAILQAPFFDPNADAAHNYGAIGAVIGHEISHSFDNLGSQFDAEGRMHTWWTPADVAHFKAATDKLVKQFDQYQALPGLHVNGAQTLGENIADVSGLTAAWIAYHKSLDGKPAPVIDGLTGNQRLFLAFGQTWRSKMREPALRQRINTDVHAPPQFRAQTVRNLDAWYDAFDVKPGEKLYLAPKDRVKIW